jgi:DNA polymerase
MYDRPLTQLKGAVRASVTAPDEHRFLGVDLAQIEDRCGAWLSGQTEVLDLYRAGRDVYSETATELLGRPVTKANKLERQVGKTVRLSSIFGGGVGALERGAGKFDVDLEMMASLITALPFEEVESKRNLDWYYDKQGGTLPEHIAFKLDVIKCRWRRANPRTVTYWDQLFNAFVAGYGDCGFIKVRSSAAGTRVVKLPCGRDLFYRDVWNEGGQISYEGRDGANGRRGLIKGKLFENVVQACDSSVARFYMLLADPVAEIVHHAHDEYLLCVPQDDFDEVEAGINEIHTTKFPKWAPGLPITYETWSGLRYEK